MNFILRLFPAYLILEARLCAAQENVCRLEAELCESRRFNESEVDRYASARAFDAQTIENMRASHREEVGRLTDLLDKERTDRQWATDRLLESRNVRPIYEASPRERQQAEAEKDSIPRETLGPRQRATARAQDTRAEALRGVEAQVSEFTARLKQQHAEEERAREEKANRDKSANGSGV